MKICTGCSKFTNCQTYQAPCLPKTNTSPPSLKPDIPSIPQSTYIFLSIHQHISSFPTPIYKFFPTPPILQLFHTTYTSVPFHHQYFSSLPPHILQYLPITNTPVPFSSNCSQNKQQKKEIGGQHPDPLSSPPRPYAHFNLVFLQLCKTDVCKNLASCERKKGAAFY